MLVLGDPTRNFLPALIIAFIATGCGSVAARTWQVPLQAPAIAAGIDSAAAGDTVLVACGTYFEHDLQLKSDLLLRGETGQPDCVIIDAQQQGRVLSCSGLQNVSIVGVTVTGGRASSGGGIYCGLVAGLNLSRCTLAGNVTWNAGGGGLFCSASQFAIADCLFEGNDAQIEYGGGAIFIGQATGSIIGCVFRQNHAILGAGLACHGASPEVRGCRFEGNSANWGAGIDCTRSAPIITGCSFADNEANRGAALSGWVECSPRMISCSVTGNAAADRGGAIYLTAYGGTSDLYLENTDFGGNSAPAGRDGYLDAACSATLVCCLTAIDRWQGEGLVSVVAEGCGIPTAAASWGAVKLLYK